MNPDTAMEIIHAYTWKKNLTEDEAAVFEEALRYMLETDYGSETVWAYNLAFHYQRTGYYGKAVKYYTFCIRHGLDMAYLGLGDAYALMDEIELACQAYDKAKEAGY